MSSIFNGEKREGKGKDENVFANDSDLEAQK